MRLRIRATVTALLVVLLSVGISPAMAGTGLGPKDVYVQDESGAPITGGAVSWRMSDGSARSARTYGLTADGLITFPYAPAGDAILTITAGQMASGDTISGRWTISLDNSGTRVTLANAPSHAEIVQVVGPDGGGVAGAVVTLSSTCDGKVWDDQATWVDGYYDENWNWVSGYYEGGYVDGEATTSLTSSIDLDSGTYGYSRTTESVWDSNYNTIYQATTESDGAAVFWGYGNPLGCRQVSVEYNDGVVIQSASGELGGVVTLPYVPVVTLSATDVRAAYGEGVNIPVSVLIGTNAQTLARQKPQGISTTVSIVPPKGAAHGRCGAKLKAKTNRNGKATLRVCATASGSYSLRVKGSMRKAGVRLLVKGAPSTPVTSVTAKSPDLGELSVSWNPPEYSGGSKISSYVVSVLSGGSVVKRIRVKANKRSARFSGLGHTAAYKVSIVAVTRHGQSAAVTKTVVVA